MSRAPSSPAVSPRRMSVRICTSTSPASSFSTTRWIETPVTSSPASNAAGIGDAPRWRGNNEGCTFKQSIRGRSRNSWRRSSPYATTRKTSASRARSSARNASSRTDSGCSTSIPSARASSATGEGKSLRPRPRGRTGGVTTRAGRKGDAARRARIGVANGGEPRKTKRTRIPGWGSGRDQPSCSSTAAFNAS